MLEVCLAKPQSDKKFDGANPHSSGPHPNYIPHPGYGGFPGNPYGPLGAGYGGVASNFQQVFLADQYIIDVPFCFSLGQPHLMRLHT